jgi:hypothetical protein
VGGFESFCDPESYAGGSIATGRVTQAGQVKGQKPDEERHPCPPGWGLGARPATSPRKRPNTAKNAQILRAGRMDNRRPKRVSRNKKENIHLGTWNVLTMLQPGKMQEVTEQILQTELQIVALQEIRWKGQGQIKKDKYNLYYSCKEGQTGQLGTGFLAKKEIVKNIMGFEPINERICKLRLKGKYHNITIINIHAPPEQKDEDTKERFYAELQQIQEKVPNLIY